MPRDRDIDIIEAISIANGSVGGAGGASGIAVIPARGPGNIIPPSRATIVRKLPNKQQIMIRVDLNKLFAIHDIEFWCTRKISCRYTTSRASYQQTHS
jgi:hypothetical protein